MATFSDVNDVVVLVSAILSPITGKGAINVDGTSASDSDIEAAKMGLLFPAVSGSGAKKVLGKIEGALTSRQARRKVMREQGIPTSQPLIPDKATKSKDKVYLTRDKDKTVQNAKNDRGHEGEPHWEAGPTKKDPSKPDGLNRSGANNKPQMAKPKSKEYYEEK